MGQQRFSDDPIAVDLNGDGRNSWIGALAVRALMGLRPWLGWPVFIGCMALAAFPALGLEETGWLGLHRTSFTFLWTGPLGVFFAWLILGWRRPFLDAQRTHWWVRSVQFICALTLLTVGALLTLSQLSVAWTPGPVQLWRTAWAQSWPLLAQQIGADWARLADHYLLWWQGVRGDGAAQDNLVFAGLTGLVFWWIGVLCAWLTRRFRSGLLAALPPLWLLSLILLYSDRGRLLLVAALGLALSVHLLLDQAGLVRRWQERGIDYSPSLVVERFAPVAGVMALILFAAAFLPSPGVNAVAWRYSELMEPVNERGDALVKRLFPDLKGSGGRFGRGVAGGLPNDFLVTTGADLGQAEVMRVRTNEPSVHYDAPPPGHYTRGATFALYDGLGWDNPPVMAYDAFDAHEPWGAPPWRGRRPLIQQVFLTFNSQIIYAAAEPIEPGIGYRAEMRAPDDLATLRARARSYTVISQVPAVSEEALAAAEGWGPDRPLPAGYDMHLALPETVTERTRDLAAALTAESETPFAMATAIEQYLRAYAYDLDVPLPPAEVTDVADYFLFDLQRGYCDYYATAFVVMARAVGLPTRFATGFAVGQWDANERLYRVTEAEAHSWPEVYFPDYGWIPFEPTGARPVLERVGLPALSAGAAPPVTEADIGDDLTQAVDWNPEMLVWLIPLALAVWGGVWLLRNWRNRREDPWTGLLKWGAQRGRPMASDETVLEYGHALGDHIHGRDGSAADAERVAVREVAALSDDVTVARYGPEAQRPSAVEAATARWSRLRAYLWQLR